MNVMDLKRFINPRQQEQHALFLAMVKVVANQSIDNILGAAFNLVITCIQRSSKNLGDAEARYDHFFGQGKEILRSRMQTERARILQATGGELNGSIT